MNYKAIVEGLLFVVGDEGITVEELRKILELDNETLKQIFLELKRDYDKPDRGLRISYLGNAFKLTTKEEHKEFYEKLVVDTKNKTLSNASLEVLAVIAYNEPITRLKIDEIRGVKSDRAIYTLVEKGLIKENGRLDVIGRPILYGTTQEFLKYFDLENIDQMPSIDSFIREITSEEEAND